MTLPTPGDIYRSETDGSIWRVIGVCDKPRFMLERIGGPEDFGPERRQGQIDCGNMADLKRLEEK